MCANAEQGLVEGTGMSVLVATSSGEFSVFSKAARVYKCSVPVSSNGALTLLLAPDNSVFVGSGDGTVKKYRGAESSWLCVAEVTLRCVRWHRSMTGRRFTSARACPLLTRALA